MLQLLGRASTAFLLAYCSPATAQEVLTDVSPIQIVPIHGRMEETYNSFRSTAKASLGDDFSQVSIPLKYVTDDDAETRHVAHVIDSCDSFIPEIDLHMHDVSVVDRRLEEIAVTATALENALSEIYPPEIWTSALDAWENQLVSALSDIPEEVLEASDTSMFLRHDVDALVDIESLVATIDLRRAAMRPDLVPLYIVPSGCGGVDIGIEQDTMIIPDPITARVWLISQWDFELCRIRGDDPWNLESCPWGEVIPQRRFRKIGAFSYQVMWNDGNVRRGNRLVLGRGSEVLDRITLTKSE